MRILSLLLLLNTISLLSYSQDINDLQKQVTDMLESMAGQQEGHVDYEEVLNDLIKLGQNPVNLNTAEKEELEQLFFLTDFQIENFLFYRYQNGFLYSIYELQAVENMDSTTIRYMLPFVRVEPISKKQNMQINGKLLGRLQSTIETPLGYLPSNDTLPPAYAGSKEKWLTRGHIYLGQKAEMGFTLEKDQGEKAFPNYFPKADFTSGFIRFNKPVKFISIWIVGDYRLSFGQGLAVWTDMAFSKSTETAQLRRRPKGIKAYTSVNESSFLRGSAIKFKKKNWSLSPFISYKKRDASSADDSLSNDFISSLQETGYHRTATEIANRNAVRETIYGAQTDYRHHLFHLDAGYVHWQIDQSIKTKDHIKDKYRFNGDKQESGWLSYAVFFNHLSLFGEVVVQNQDGWGLFQGLTYNAGDDVVASLAYRKYSNAYSAILSNPFSESATQGGESGLFASLRFKPTRKLEVKAFADIFSYKWLRYNIYRPSDGFEWFTQMNYQINYQNSFYLRYKSTQKEVNSSVPGSNYRINTYQKNNMRLFYAHQSNEKWRLQTQVEHTTYKEAEIHHTGWLAFQDIRYKHNRILEVALRYAMFDIDNYNSRIYSYEPDILYAFTVPSYMNKGIRFILNLNFTPLKNIKIWGRLSQTNYRKLSGIGTGNQFIPGHKLSEYKLQVQYRF